MPDASVPAVEFHSVSKSYGATRAVDRLSLSIAPGEFFSILGPSGCGKTTTLRLLAGLELPDPGGTILIHGEDVTGRRPYDRRLSMVFQNYALFPHLSVERNVAFGLEQRRVPASAIPARVRQGLELVRLDPATFARRMPSQLSGGQRQRVALARALVLEPAILLLDEPLGAIDLKLRKQMQLELKALNRRLGLTFVYVTHDQEEALTMSDRIAVMEQARVAQVGTPAQIYEDPRTAFVAGFIGESNFLDGRADGRADGRTVVYRADGSSFLLPDQLEPGRQVRIAIRPEWLDLFPPGQVPPAENAIPGTVREVIYRGETIHVLVDVGEGETMTVALRNEGQLIKPVSWRRGDRVIVGWLPE
ncbi:MAG TPA: ABC transporter ATP-binding protein, partial [Gemmatimonadales bacterium]